MADSGTYMELAERNLHHIADGGREEQAEYISRGHAWATLALAAAVSELAEAQQARS
jgi:hypothetical protein